MSTDTFHFLTAEQHGLRNHICMIPCGGLAKTDKREWTTTDFDLYTSYMIDGKKVDDLFGGFIFNGICTRDDSFIYPLYVGFGQPSNKTDWMEWLNQLFKKQRNLDALRQSVQTNTRPDVDVWVSIPYPHPFQKAFGRVNDRVLNFEHEEDRYEAVKWWIDQFLARWEVEKSNLHPLRLRGFLWQREAIDPHDEPLVKQCNEYVHTKNTKTMWLPNFGSYGVITWKDMGFDIVAVHSNYYGNTSYSHEWITNAANFARTFHTGLQIVYGDGLIFNDTHFIDYLNLGLADKNNYMENAFLVYQFPNQSLQEIYRNNRNYYIYLYTFIKGLYQQISYPGMSY